VVRLALSTIQGSYREYIDDLTQETFVKAWKAIDRLDQNANVTGWMGRIAQNVARDFLRYMQSCHRLDCPLETDDGMMHDIPDTHIAIQLVCVEESSAIAQAYAQLPPDDQRVMALLAQEYTVSEIATALHLDMVTCETSVKRARRRFRRAYAQA
jgi:RNA polymerase sigma-70 factor (ECF subfamily)